MTMENQAQTQPDLQICPTRVDGALVLFAHKVTAAQCQDRQRGAYHKCFTCAFNNAYVAAHGRPDAAARKPAPAAPAVKTG